LGFVPLNIAGDKTGEMMYSNYMPKPNPRFILGRHERAKDMFRRVGWIVGSLLLVCIGFAVVTPVSAQSRSNLAFVNSSGQLVVSSGDGSYRWIVTNPDETLVAPLGFTWSLDGRRLFFAVNAGYVSLRVGDIASQSVVEIGQASGSQFTGGQWTPDGSGVLVAVDAQLNFYSANGGGSTLLSGQGGLRLISPFADAEPNLAQARSLSPDGRYIFYWQSSGQYAILPTQGGSPLALPGTNNPDAPQSGLWSDSGSLVAYWGSAGGSSTLSVTNAANGQTVTLNSGRTAPITPVAWRPGSQQLIYRDTSNTVKIADLSCLNNGCGGDPLESGVDLLPATASDIQVVAGWALFVDNGQVEGVHLDCASAGNCIGSIALIGSNAAPQTILDAAGNTLVYTAYNQDAYNPADREVRAVNLSCLGASCQPQALVSQAVAGLVSPDGAYVVVDQGGNGMNALSLQSLQLTYLSGAGNNLLTTARSHFLAVLALTVAHDGREQIQARAVGQRHDAIDHFADLHRSDGLASCGRIRNADARPQ